MARRERAALAVGRVQQPIRIDATLEVREERFACSPGRLERIAAGVKCVGADAGAERPLGGGETH